jgi:hypothetical protein
VQPFSSFKLKDYIIRFTNTLDPNEGNGLGIKWPQYDIKKLQNLLFQDSSLFPMRIIAYDYRKGPMDYVANLSLIYPI